MAAMTRSQRLHLARQATEIRHRCLRDGLAPEAIAEVICREVPQMFALEAWRLAHGWSRTEVSARLDALYEGDGLATPRISSAELCRWEHGQRRPSDERIEYLCRLYSTRPHRLGCGMAYSNAEVGHLARAGITDLWPRTSPETYADLVERVRTAQEEITVVGLARNFYAKDEILPLFESKAVAILDFRGFRWWGWPAELTGLPDRAEQASIGGSSSQGVTTDAHAEPTALARRPAHRVSSLLYPRSAVRRHAADRNRHLTRSDGHCVLVRHVPTRPGGSRDQRPSARPRGS